MIRLFLLATVLAADAPAAAPAPAGRPRLIVLTDISSLTSRVAEPDDGQSMVRLMLYTNEFDVEGLVASSNMGHGQTVRPELIRRVVDAYGAVQPNLLQHDPAFPAAEVLRSRIKAGQPIAGPKVPVTESIGDGKDTEASGGIIHVVDQPVSRPVWVLIWGGSADLAQALWRVRQTRSPDELARFVAKLRVHAISDQDSTGPWIRENFPGLFVITNLRAMRGMYRGGDTMLSSSAWVDAHIKGHGALGDLYPSYDGGDIWSRTLGRVRGIKEGDTPSFLYLLNNGLCDPDRPELGGWGGRFEGAENRYTDIPDQDLNTTDDPDPRMVTVYRWRPAFQADFQARFDWCVKTYAEANHPPVVRVRGERVRSVAPAEEVVLDASDSTDPDGDGLRFEWSLYPAMSDGPQEITLVGRTSSVARLRVPPGYAGCMIPVLLTVQDDGDPGLTRYGRVLLTVPVVDVSGHAKLMPHPDAVPNIHPPGDVDKPELVPFIVADPSTLPGIVVDETSAALVGKWQYSTHTPPYVGLGYLHDQNEGKGKKSVTFTPDLPHDGVYEVRLAHCYNIRRATNTPVTIHHAGGEVTIRINQQETPPHDRLFRTLGTFRFQAGRSGWVRISNDGTEGKYAIADAVQWLPRKDEAK